MRFILLIPIFLLSCTDAKFEMGSCIQKPDEIYKYRIIELDQNIAKLEALNGGILEEAKLGSHWVTTKCE